MNPSVRLTQAEQKTLALIADGYKDQSIAETLGVKITTVRFHIRNIYEKLGVHNRVQATMSYYEKGIVGNGRQEQSEPGIAP